eukprot:TRINITY_DN8074_c0_g1_i4.p1 TRINITY_DN8074_c0_g1~~TRINITY_DN8074_c0_g1_i4.p1  ORF type:complete len:415 (+),score=42.35 TRINITY_DN8074_c0_g1_i4:711-1955(+)
MPRYRGKRNKYRASIQQDAGDVGFGEFPRQPKGKRAPTKANMRVLPVGMKSETARFSRKSIYHQIGMDPPESLSLKPTERYHTYEGVFRGFGVEVSEHLNMSWLYTQGYFGKGILSRSEPVYSRTLMQYSKGTKERATSLERRIQKKKNRIQAQEERKRKKAEKGSKSGHTSRTQSRAETPSIVDAANLDDSTGELMETSLEAPLTADALNDESCNGLDSDNCSATPQLPQHVTRECLQLSLEEAFFLCHGLGCLKITDAQGHTMTMAQCWTAFCKAKPSFVENYAVYLHLRSRGWVPKMGLKFAVDWLAYRQGPEFYHSSYSILTRTAWEDTKAAWSACDQPISWQYLSNISRMSGQAGKEAVICYVIRPRSLTDQDLAHPSCLPRLKVQQVLHRRWVPAKTRTAPHAKKRRK